jgi:mRNA-degrading endonuclease toxin of MazEF toxin-antitoxin module
VKRGEIRWYTFRLPDKRRPVLILTRDELVELLGELIVVPATRTVRGLSTEVVLGPEHGEPLDVEAAEVHDVFSCPSAEYVPNAGIPHVLQI